VVSALRGHALAHAAKCLILLVKIGKKQTHYVLAVVPGDARLDLKLVKFFTKRFRGNVGAAGSGLPAERRSTSMTW
jgi:prolyl-tRNA editing enzyme YbaK/EbsC (Cys-tRNA(Pro) deacylase)